MDRFDDILMEAATAIGEHYFCLPVDGADPVYRERVYCYELYYQMRARWPEGCPYSLNGEVDKQNHPYLGEGAPKPDFLVHVPGTGNNYAAMEVKKPDPAANDIRKDIDTLVTFRDWYERGLYLIYGVEPSEALERVTAACAKTEDLLTLIELWVHPAIGAPAQKVAWENG